RDRGHLTLLGGRTQERPQPVHLSLGLLVGSQCFRRRVGLPRRPRRRQRVLGPCAGVQHLGLLPRLRRQQPHPPAHGATTVPTPVTTGAWICTSWCSPPRGSVRLMVVASAPEAVRSVTSRRMRPFSSRVSRRRGRVRPAFTWILLRRRYAP